MAFFRNIPAIFLVVCITKSLQQDQAVGNYGIDLSKYSHLIEVANHTLMQRLKDYQAERISVIQNLVHSSKDQFYKAREALHKLIVTDILNKDKQIKASKVLTPAMQNARLKCLNDKYMEFGANKNKAGQSFNQCLEYDNSVQDLSFLKGQFEESLQVFVKTIAGLILESKQNFMKNTEGWMTGFHQCTQQSLAVFKSHQVELEQELTSVCLKH